MKQIAWDRLQPVGAGPSLAPVSVKGEKPRDPETIANPGHAPWNRTLAGIQRGQTPPRTAIPVRAAVLALILCAIALPQTATVTEGPPATPPPESQEVMSHIRAASLRGHLSFISSDLLEGRNTPSRGLDMAAEYIAAQFRRAGLDPAGDDGYFQTAKMISRQQQQQGFRLAIRSVDKTFRAKPARLIIRTWKAVDLSKVELVKVDFDDDAALGVLTTEQVRDKVVITESPDLLHMDAAHQAAAEHRLGLLRRTMDSLRPAMVVTLDPSGGVEGEASPTTLIDPGKLPNESPYAAILLQDDALTKLYRELPAGPATATVTAHIPAPAEREVKVRNVIGVLRGSDPVLKNTYVLVTAHYDHVGEAPDGEGDRIFNGANDDGSGTVSVIELASVLAALETPPKRSIVFMTFFGEEKGLFGSRYYASHPAFPLENTVADLNLEQLGRTDSSEGPQVSRLSVTGFDFSDVGTILKVAGEKTGVEVYGHASGDDYFDRSDNQAIADAGVPAHTLVVAYDFPDYHQPGDEWQKIDYDNMAKVDRTIALGILMIADSEKAPGWNETNRKTAQYVEVWKKKHQVGAAGSN